LKIGRASHPLRTEALVDLIVLWRVLTHARQEAPHIYVALRARQLLLSISVARVSENHVFWLRHHQVFLESAVCILKVARKPLDSLNRLICAFFLELGQNRPLTRLVEVYFVRLR
jgi:hypothetical protein